MRLFPKSWKIYSGDIKEVQYDRMQIHVSTFSIVVELHKFEALIDIYNNKCKIFVLMHCETLCKSWRRLCSVSGIA
jgi:hypothetical protein